MLSGVPPLMVFVPASFAFGIQIAAAIVGLMAPLSVLMNGFV